ncbi:MAG TPA: amidohydrolase family protein [Acidimicrobiales bacterium]
MTDLEQRAPHLVDPEPRRVTYTVISVDDHLVEPPNVFEGRLPAKLAEGGPRLITDESGNEVWLFDGKRYELPCLGAVVGRPKEEWTLEPTRFDQVRPGCYDIHERIKDMDINGIWASVNFPSQITGFCGSVYSACSDPELGHAVVRAWNDWHYEEWYLPYPTRTIATGITFLGDADLGAAEIRRNAARGFRAVSLPEQPHNIGLPSLNSGWWDPIIDACVETETVICLHVGSSGLPVNTLPSDVPLLQLGSTLFPVSALTSCAVWLWSGYPFRYPDLKVALSEGGIGWVAMFLDRLDSMVDRTGYGQLHAERPSDVVRRNFWFCTIDDRSTVVTKDTIGVENICVETDYPHGDGTWPDSQATLEALLSGWSEEDSARVTHENAAALFRHPLPESGTRLAAGLRRRA